MDETGFGIITNSAGMHGHGTLINLRDARTGELDIDGLSFHMEAMARHAAIGTPHALIRPRGAIAGNHLIDALAPHFYLDGPEDVEELRVDDMDLPGLIIAEKAVDLCQGSPVVRLAGGIGESQFLLGTGMNKRKGAFIQRLCTADGRSGDNAQAKNDLSCLQEK